MQAILVCLPEALPALFVPVAGALPSPAPQKLGVADYVDDTIAEHQPVAAYHLGNRHSRSDLHGWNSRLFQLSGDRSAAASARASGRG